MKNKLFKSLIIAVISVVIITIPVFAKDIATIHNDFNSAWNSTSASVKTAYFWEEDDSWGVYKISGVSKLSAKQLEKFENDELGIEEYGGEREGEFVLDGWKFKIQLEDTLNGVCKIGNKYYVMEGGLIADNTNTSGYANKKDAEKVQKNGGEEEKKETEEKEEDEDSDKEDSEEDKLSKIKLPILEDGIDGTWHEAKDVSSIKNASSDDWVFITSDNDLIKNGFIVVKEVNSDKYNVSKFNKDGIWEGYLDKTGTLSKTSGNNKTLDEVIEIAKNKSKASTLNLDSQEEGELEDNSSGSGGSSGNGGSSGGSSNGSSSGKKKSYKVEKVDSIEPTFKLSDLDYLRNSNGLQMFGMCISKDYARVNEMTEWYNKDDNMVKAGDWFEKAKYTWNITKDLLNNALSGKNYDYGGKDVFRYDKTVLQSMQGKITEVQKQKQDNRLSTGFLIVGVFLMIYAIVMVLCWFIDTRGITFIFDGGDGGLFNLVTIGKMRASSDNLQWVDDNATGKAYILVDAKRLLKMFFGIFIIGLFIAVPITREFVVYYVQKMIDWFAKVIGFTMDDL